MTAPVAAHPASDTAHPENPLHRLTKEQIEELGREFDSLHEQVKSDLGQRDADYIRGVIALHRRLALMGRATLVGSRNPVAWVLGTAMQSTAKILENMEIGHNVLHGQWDWMNDPVINSQAWDWDTASTSEAWRHSHNYIHHTYTNILGKDKDLGYEIMRIDPNQKWHPVYLIQPVVNLILMALFEWGVAFHDMDLEAIRKGEKTHKEALGDLKGIAGKARAQVVKDYIAWPLLSALIAGGVDLAIDRLRPPSKRERVRGAGRRLRTRIAKRERVSPRDLLLDSMKRTYIATAKANATSNVIRNLWAHAIIFCGHFPDQAYVFTQDETEEETTGARYVRQLLGACNIEGGPMFHLMSGNLGYQVEHHLYPDMPSTRYAEIAPAVRDICLRYELPYNTGPFFKQVYMVNRTIVRLAFPGGKPRPKPGPYRGEDGDYQPASNGNGHARNGSAGSNGSGPEQPTDGVRVS
ncbi:MAG: NADPH-dependent stearoyl-CoA 9-desaturase, partial [Thermoleophilaceae bacterium]|nr:NADPH-dependent stearoyl-CoA 9-desaturase [Thermoleophilaceae bacterium]